MLIYLLPATGSVSYFRLRAAQFVLHFTSLLLCRRSSLREQQRAYLMSAAPLWFAQSLTFFFIFLPKQWNICCQLLHIPGYHGCQAPPHHAQCMVYMTHTGIEVIGQAGGSVAPRCSGVVRVVVAFLLEPYICLQVFFYAL